MKGALQIQIELITQLFTFVSGLKFEEKSEEAFNSTISGKIDDFVSHLASGGS